MQFVSSMEFLHTINGEFPRQMKIGQLLQQTCVCCSAVITYFRREMMGNVKRGNMEGDVQDEIAKCLTYKFTSIRVIPVIAFLF